ncbi:DNA topoisomerase 1, partial [Diplonema papillatum]
GAGGQGTRHQLGGQHSPTMTTNGAVPADMDAVAQAGEAVHGKIVKHLKQADFHNVIYANGTKAKVAKTGTVTEMLANKLVLFVNKAGSRFTKTPEGKFVPWDGALPQAPAQTDAKPVAKAAAPSPKKELKTESKPVKKEKDEKPVAVKEEGRKKEAPATQAASNKLEESEKGSSSSSSSSSSSESASDSEDSETAVISRPKKVAKKASPKKKEAPVRAPKKAPAKKASPKKEASSPRKRKRIADSDDEEVVAKIVDINNDDEATLALITLKIAETLDLGEAAEKEIQRLREEELKNRKPPKRPSRTPFPQNPDALEKKIGVLEAQLKREISKMSIKDGTKEVSLTTSKTNYIDPRVVCAWCTREDVRPTQVYSATLLKKFPWARHVEPDWRF